jgi:radical SAM protein with 4Fe4S-binding SPASM domain
LPDILQLSIDGATKESFEAIRKLGDFDKIIDNYRAICALRADGKTRPYTVIRVFCALQRGNLHDYRAMYGLIRTLRGIDSFGLVPVSYGSASGPQIPGRDEVLALHRELDAAIDGADGEDEKSFYRQWRKVSAEWLKDKAPARLDPETNRAPCTVPWFSTYIDAKGRVYPCCYLTGTRHQMGTLGKDGSGFDDIWRGERYRDFRAKLISDRPGLEGCRTCPRNDAKVLATLDKMQPLLPRADA